MVPVPATQGSAPVSHSSLKRRKARGASRRIETWGFPSPAERRLRLPPHPRPKCQVSSRGGGWLRGLPSRAAQAAKSPLPSGGQDRARTHSYTHSRTFTHSLVHRHTRSDVLPRRRQRSLRAARTFRASRRAGRVGRGAGSGEIGNRFGGLPRISLLEAKPHKPNPLSARRPRGESTRSQNEGQLGAGHLVSATRVSKLQAGGRPEVSQRGSGRRAPRVESPLNPACLAGNTLALFPLQSPRNPEKAPQV